MGHQSDMLYIEMFEQSWERLKPSPYSYIDTHRR